MTTSKIKEFKAFLLKNAALEDFQAEYDRRCKTSKTKLDKLDKTLESVHQEAALDGVIDWKASIKGFNFWNTLDTKWFNHIR